MSSGRDALPILLRRMLGAEEGGDRLSKEKAGEVNPAFGTTIYARPTSHSGTRAALGRR